VRDATTPSLALEVLRDGKVLVKASLAAGNPDAQGRVQQIGQMPLATLSAGSYVLRLTVEQGSSRQVREAPFTVVDAAE
jgi:hypothetical protein